MDKIVKFSGILRKTEFQQVSGVLKQLVKQLT